MYTTAAAHLAATTARQATIWAFPAPIDTPHYSCSLFEGPDATPQACSRNAGTAPPASVAPCISGSHADCGGSRHKGAGAAPRDGGPRSRHRLRRRLPGDAERPPRPACLGCAGVCCWASTCGLPMLQRVKASLTARLRTAGLTVTIAPARRRLPPARALPSPPPSPAAPPAAATSCRGLCRCRWGCPPRAWCLRWRARSSCSSCASLTRVGLLVGWAGGQVARSGQARAWLSACGCCRTPANHGSPHCGQFTTVTQHDPLQRWP